MEDIYRQCAELEKHNGLHNSAMCRTGKTLWIAYFGYMPNWKNTMDCILRLCAELEKHYGLRTSAMCRTGKALWIACFGNVPN